MIHSTKPIASWKLALSLALLVPLVASSAEPADGKGGQTKVVIELSVNGLSPVRAVIDVPTAEVEAFATYLDGGLGQVARIGAQVNKASVGAKSESCYGGRRREAEVSIFSSGRLLVKRQVSVGFKLPRTEWLGALNKVAENALKQVQSHTARTVPVSVEECDPWVHDCYLFCICRGGGPWCIFFC